VFFVVFFEKLFGKNENWTFLKMSKSEKSWTKFDFENAYFGNI